jgi:hypothetical protein
MKRIAIACAAAAALAVGGASAAAGGLSGTFKTKIAGAPAAQFDGVWTITVARNGRYTIALGGKTLIAGAATVRASTIAFGRESGPAACTGAQGTGVYTWRRSGKTLRFTRTSDRCPGRAFVLAHVFTATA